MTMTMSDMQASLLTAGLSQQVTRFLSEPLPDQGRLAVGIIGNDNCTVNWVVHDILSAISTETDGNWRVDILPDVADEIKAAVEQVGQNETGGYLMGRINWVLRRIFDIASDQIRALRSRLFVEALTSGKAKGALIRIGNSVRDIDIKSGQKRTECEYRRFQPDEVVSQAHRHPTNLSAIPSETFDLIARHGFECADATLTAHRIDLIKTSISWENTIL